MTTASESVDRAAAKAAGARPASPFIPAYAFTAAADGRFIGSSPTTTAFVTDEEELDFSSDKDEFGWPRIVHPDEFDATVAKWQHCIRTGEPCDNEHRLRLRDGQYRWFRTSLRPLRDDTGRVIEWHGLSVDIDDQKRVEEALRRSERRLQEMIDAVPVRIWSAGPTGGQLQFNKRYLDYLRSVVSDPEAFQYPSIERFLRELIHADDAPSVQRAMQKGFETGSPSVMRFRGLGPEGDYRWAECRVEPRRDDHGVIVQWYAVSLDIEDEVRAQEELRRTSDKLARAAQAASLAELSASIAHEVNQPLAAVVANSHACERWLSADPPNMERAKSTIQRIIRDANAAAEVVSHIRALFKQSVEPSTGASAKIDGVIGEALSFIAEEATRRSVRLDVDLEEGLPSLALDRVQIQQVLINLVRNGLDAMEASPGDKTLGIRVRTSDGAVETAVMDNGPGIEQPDRIFDAFYTTKPHGMGMGLAICRSIVESHGGRLWAEANEPRGARVVFTLPVAAKGVG